MLKQLQKNPEKANDVSLAELVALIEQSNKAYYQDGVAIMSDDLYDILTDILKKRKPGITLFKYSLDQGKKSKLPFRMGSQDKIRTPKEIANWEKKYKDSDYLFQDKEDGCSFLYANNKLFTRGDGTYGRNITHLLSYIQCPDMPDDIAIAGELIISKKSFTRYGNDFATARAMVAGLINRDSFNADVLKLVKLIHLIAFEIVETSQEAPSTQLQTLESLGFEVPHHWTNTELTYTALEKVFIKRRKTSPYDIDGIVIYADEPHKRSTKGNPDYSIAFKTLLPDQIKTTQVTQIEWNSSRLGDWRPIVHFNPVNIGGVTIRKATGHNPDFIRINGIGVGAIIQIVRSGDVIPYIHSVNKKVKPSTPPKQIELDVVQLKQIEHFIVTIGVEGVKLRSLEKLGNISLKKLLSLDKSDWVDTLGAKSGANAYKSIKAAITKIPLLTALGASPCFPGLGRKTLAKVFDVLITWQGLGGRIQKSKDLKDTLLEIPGIQELTADKLITGINKFEKWLKQHPKITTIKKKAVKKAIGRSNYLANEVFVFSGFRDEKIKETIEQNGGSVSDTLNRKTTTLVVKKESESSKVKKAREYGISIITLANLVKRLGKL